MSINGMNEGHWIKIDEMLDSINILFDTLGEIPSDIGELLNAEEERQQYLEEHNRPVNEEISSEISDIDIYIQEVSNVRENLESIMELLEKIKGFGGK